MKHLEAINNQIFELEELLKRVSIMKFRKKKIVFTNGCFDLLHPGHIQYLSEAADLGDVLIVGINSDESVKRLKGPGRPIQGQSGRAQILASLQFVNAVTIFQEDTPIDLIKAIEPDVLVKGGDWPVDQIVGHSVVSAYGGKVCSLPFLEGFSTTMLSDKLKEA